MKKYSFFLIFISLLPSLISCSSKRYLRELPYYYPSEGFYKAVVQQKELLDKQYSLVDDNGENLSDIELQLKEKYSIILGMNPKDVKNYKLYQYIDSWIGTPYKEGVFERQVGVETSYLIQALFSDVYQVTFAKTPDGIFRSKDIQLFTGRTFLEEGDILFFRYDKFQPISDVGLYLGNDRILACTINGLNIYDFNDSYFQLRYVGAGRLKKGKK
ncbi:NlpC/P60 family protein [Capnocytophaga canis]|uniref:NlpC/P60 family protein n=1 Tax=Capnocytophaga canis TaxID=1848903 RepID=UPI00370D1AB2